MNCVRIHDTTPTYAASSVVSETKSRALSYYSHYFSSNVEQAELQNSTIVLEDLEASGRVKVRKRQRRNGSPGAMPLIAFMLQRQWQESVMFVRQLHSKTSKSLHDDGNRQSQAWFKCKELWLLLNADDLSRDQPSILCRVDLQKVLSGCKSTCIQMSQSLA